MMNTTAAVEGGIKSEDRISYLAKETIGICNEGRLVLCAVTNLATSKNRRLYPLKPRFYDA